MSGAKRAIVLFVLLGSFFFWRSSAFAALFVNGHAVQDEAITVEGSTLVKLRALTDPSWLVFAYDNKTHIVTAHTKDNSKFLQMKVGEKTAAVNGKPVVLDVPAVVKNGLTYVPLRFIGETLGVQVTNNATEKRVIVRTPRGQSDYKMLMNGDLTEARRIAIGLSRVSNGSVPSFDVNWEGWSSTSYSFPEGETLRFTVEMEGETSYYEVNDEGLAVLKGKVYPEKNQAWGTVPSFGASVFFWDEFMAGLLDYGRTDENGKPLQTWRLGDPDNPNGWNIVPIDGEQRIDAAA
ncbi:copper amine oxidase N-terminal domain-containing protein [Paenibacillus glycinis]|uniref:copper amine oxidase N-terminal domain-containing protein n=1 Tax=Paenibacillus glycinis TaxID=2697035 RepID=UPI002E2D7286|nr:copper amine oxidase N-terminal domain-containing protein [Paenibacillus glycinis]